MITELETKVEEGSLEDWKNKALTCLYIAVDASIADDVNQRVNAYCNQLKREKEEAQLRAIQAEHRENDVRQILTLADEERDGFEADLKVAKEKIVRLEAALNNHPPKVGLT